MKRTRKKKQELRGFIQSGLLFIGDPTYMAGDQSKGPIEEDATNPFKNWDQFTTELNGQDANLPFPGAFEETSIGRGVVVQTNRLSGKYELKKKFDKDGKLLQISVKFHD